MNYTAVIRTLGTAGDKYQQLLNSLVCQSIKPDKIIVYIAEGYPIPKETIGWEQYVYVKKGMVAQRALQYKEVDTEYILFLDDDVLLGKDSVESLYNLLIENDAQVISPDVFQNAARSKLSRLAMFISGRIIGRKDDDKWGYKVMRNAGYSYNLHPKTRALFSQTNAGPCFFCTKEDFLKIHFEEEIWIDKSRYALGEDQTMFYKMYLMGLKQLTWFGCSIRHLDARSTMQNEDVEKMLVYSDFRFKTIFWHRFIYKPDRSLFSRIQSAISIGYTFAFSFIVSLLKGRMDILSIKYQAIKESIQFICSEEYAQLPLIERK